MDERLLPDNLLREIQTNPAFKFEKFLGEELAAEAKRPEHKHKFSLEEFFREISTFDYVADDSEVSACCVVYCLLNAIQDELELQRYRKQLADRMDLQNLLSSNAKFVGLVRRVYQHLTTYAPDQGLLSKIKHPYIFCLSQEY